MNTVVNSKFDRSELRIINNRRRREQELKRHICIFVLSIVLLASLAVLVFSTKSLAASHSDETLYKYFKSVEIKPGDTLYDLSNEYLSEGYVSSEKLMCEIMYINHLDNNTKLISGKYIIIPYYDTYRG